ncbi:MAG: FAD-dependent oxidoreductase, partial [Microcoleaceae cyanobacterium]
MTNTQITHEIVIIGGGAAGITTAAQLLKRKPSLDVAIIEPSDKHYYQPGWTLIGAGVFTPEQVTRDEKLLIPNGAKWIKDAVTKLEPDDNKVITQNGLTIQYKYLIVCPGMKIDWSVIKGLPETLGKNGVTSNYYLEGASYTWELIQNFQGGTALFTFPAGAIKCPGAPQKIMYLAEDYFRNKSGVRNKTQVIYGCATPGIFGVPTFAKSLVKVAADRGIDVRYQHNLKE